MVLLVLTFSTVFGFIYGLSTALLDHKLHHADTNSKHVLKRLPKSASVPVDTWKF